MPAPCTLLLELYEEDGVTLDWDVSSDPAHARPWLLPIQHYGTQELDPVAGAATIGTVQVGVADVPTVEGDQTTGWMTARVHAVHGRRCRLRWYVDDVQGYATIADGPAGAPQIDNYAAYRWMIRDGRERERRLTAFITDGRGLIMPRSDFPRRDFVNGISTTWGGALFGFGDLGGGDWLLPPRDVGSQGAFRLVGQYVAAPPFGYVDFSAFWNVDDLYGTDFIVDEPGEQLLQGVEDGSGYVVFPNADVLWREWLSSDPWNVARPAFSPANPETQRQLAVLVDTVHVSLGECRIARRVYLWQAESPPAGFPANGTYLEAMIRHRGPASEDYPFYWEGTVGALLAAVYDGTLAQAPDLGGALYDPAGLEAGLAVLADQVSFDAAAVAALTTAVVLRQTEPVTNGREWAESAIYGPLGYMPALDADFEVAPVSRARPATVTGPTITDAVAEPSSEWNPGERIVTAIELSYPRYFLPAPRYPPVAVALDALAIRSVTITYRDPTAEAIHGPHAYRYPAHPFGAIGDGAGNEREGATEVGKLLALEARWEVLQRYRNGAASTAVAVRRADLPALLPGDWVGVELSWLPNPDTGLRGLVAEAAQVLGVAEDDCAWRALLVEISEVPAPPGYFSDLGIVEDEAAAGYFSALDVIFDVEGGS